MKKRFIKACSILMAVILCCAAVMCVQATENDPVTQIMACNLSFSETVYIKYAVRFENVSADDVKMLVWLSPKNEYTEGSEAERLSCSGTAEIGGEDCLIFDYKGLAAKQMTDDVYARAYVEKGGKKYYSSVKKYSVLQYAYNMLGKTGTPTDNQNLRDLLSSMLEYGAKAQNYFDYNTERLATGEYYRIKVIGGTLGDLCDSGLYKENETVRLTANNTDENGNAFAYWRDGDGNKASGVAQCFITVENKNQTYTAVYSVPTSGLEYDSNGDGTCTVTGLADGCTDTDIVIPAAHNGESVIEIDVAAFSGEDIVSITIPATVEAIGRKAFNNCEYLTDVYYQGTRAQWDEITVGSNNLSLTQANIHYTGESTYTVTFRDYDGRIIKSETVYSGESATPPPSPMREGYTFSGWSGEYTNITANKSLTAVYTRETEPKITLNSVTANAGDTNVTVAVSISNNPGILGMSLHIGYNSEKLTLKDSQNGDALSALTMQKPGRYKDGCGFVWYGEKLNSGDIKDGNILLLTFDISEAAQSGSYPITVSYSAGDIYDGELTPVSIDIQNGNITVN